MLIKLLKYEFQATARTFLPVYGALFGVSLLNKTMNYDFLASFAAGIFGNALMMVFIALLCAVGVITFVSLINRFRTNLLGDEGYLMFTLPVKSQLLIWSKLIASFTWCLLSGVVVIIAFFILSFDFQSSGLFFSNLVEALAYVFSKATFSHYILALGVIVTLLLSSVSSILTLYASMSIGHLGNKHRTALSILAFLGMGVIGEMCISMLSSVGIIEWLSSNLTQASFVWVLCLFLFVIVSALMFITNYVLKCRLNLE